MSLKRLVTAKHEKLATAEIQLKKMREEIEQHNCTALEYGGVDVSACCCCFMSLLCAAKSMAAANTQLSTEGKMSSVGQLCMRTRNAAGRDLGSQINNCNVT